MLLKYRYFISANAPQGAARNFQAAHIYGLGDLRHIDHGNRKLEFGVFAHFFRIFYNAVIDEQSGIGIKQLVENTRLLFCILGKTDFVFRFFLGQFFALDGFGRGKRIFFVDFLHGERIAHQIGMVLFSQFFVHALNLVKGSASCKPFHGFSPLAVRIQDFGFQYPDIFGI